MRTWLRTRRVELVDLAIDGVLAAVIGCFIVAVGLFGGTILDHLAGR